jgi:phage baseplate assembly protein W
MLGVWVWRRYSGKGADVVITENSMQRYLTSPVEEDVVRTDFGSLLIRTDSNAIVYQSVH